LAVVLLCSTTLVVGTAVFGYVVYLADGFESELRNPGGQLRNKVEAQTASRRLYSPSLFKVESISVRTGSRGQGPINLTG
jgi:hypothetical protein